MSSPDYARSRIPRYVQVAAAIRRRIEEGRWGPNDRIPPLQDLQREFAVARVTVRQAVEMLADEGLLRRVQGAGTFISAELPERRWLKLDLKWPSIGSAIGANVPYFLEVRKNVVAPERIVPPDVAAAGYRFLVSRQSRAGSPFSFARAYVAEHIVAMAPRDFERAPTLAVIASLKSLEVASAQQSFIIGAADADIASHLEVGLGFPTAEAHVEVRTADGLLIYVADIVYRGDSVRLDVDLLG